MRCDAVCLGRWRQWHWVSGAGQGRTKPWGQSTKRNKPVGHQRQMAGLPHLLEASWSRTGPALPSPKEMGSAPFA